MTIDRDTTNRALPSGEQYSGESMSVDVVTLAESLREKIPKLMKIDVEGYEAEVLKGAEQLLSNPDLQAIIMELNGSGERLGFDEDRLHTRMLRLGFHSCTYNPLDRHIADLEGARSLSGNTLYLRDIEKATRVVCQSQSYTVLESSI